MYKHIDHNSDIVKEIESLIEEYDLTEEELQKAISIATGSCQHLGPTVEEYDGHKTIVKCSTCNAIVNKY